MNRSLRALSLGLLLVTALPAAAVGLYGVTNTGTNLVFFDSATPGTLAASLPITGLSAGDSLVGLDFRPATNALYALGLSGRLYTINTTTAVASPGALLSTALSGEVFGVDFNPTVDRLRVVSNTGQNLRINVDSGAATVDLTENFATGSGTGTPNVAAVAYTNSFAGSTTTTLYAIDTTRDALFTQAPPNDGTLNFQGDLGLDAVAGTTDFDFSYANGVNTGYAVYTLPGATTSTLYTIATNGTNTLLGSLPVGTSLRLIAAAPVPEPGVVAALGLGALTLVRRRRKA